MLNLFRNALMAVLLVCIGACQPGGEYFPGNYCASAEAAVRDVRCSRTPLRIRLVLDLDSPAEFKYVYDNDKLKVDLSTDILEETTLDLTALPLQKHKEFAKKEEAVNDKKKPADGEAAVDADKKKTAANEGSAVLTAKDAAKKDATAKNDAAGTAKDAAVKTAKEAAAKPVELIDFDPKKPFVHNAVLKRKGNGTSALQIFLLEKVTPKVMNFHKPERIVIDLNRITESSENPLQAEPSLTEAQSLQAGQASSLKVPVLPKSNKISMKVVEKAKKAVEKTKSTAKAEKPIILPSREEKKLGKGLSYTFCQKVEKYGPVRIHMLTLSPKSPFAIRPFSAAVNRQGRGRLSQAAEALNAVAAINGGYFDTDTDGWIIGNLRWQGLLMGGDSTPRSAFIIDKKGRPGVIKDVQFTGKVVFPNGGALPLTGVNRKRLAEDLLLYTGSYGMSTGTNEYGFEVMLKNGRVADMSAAGNMPIVEGAEVISGHGVMAAALESLRFGEKVKVQMSFGSKKADEAKFVLSGGPLLIEKSKINVRSEEESIARDIAKGRAPRTAIAVKADGSIIFMVIDGRSKYSKGVSLYELAGFLLDEGAVDAVNLDGGGSSEMVVEGKIVNRPSDGVERRISTAVGIFSE